jgi:EAL domain-containing protein (putative c-di-GMP-specific phosphodiesterase class I)
VGLAYVGVTVFQNLIESAGLVAALKTTADFGRTLRVLAPPETVVARVCDNGFALLLDTASETDLRELSSKLTFDAGPVLYSGKNHGVEELCSIGTTIAEPGRDSAAAALDAAYRDFVPRTAGLEEATGEASLLRGSIRNLPDAGYYSEVEQAEKTFPPQIDQALAAGKGFQLFYQPIVSLKGDSQENYSVLLRLRDTEERIREAKEFLAAAVSSGRMVAIDRWVLNRSIEELSGQHQQNRQINFFVSIGEETLLESKLLIWICDQLRHCKARGNWLTIQVLEDHARRHATEFARLSEGLRKVKCRVALNHFARGRNPQALLHTLSADYVKFAPETAAGLAEDESKQKRLAQLATAAREAGMKTVVTGVEDARTLTVLWTLGIDYVQGNFLQKPAASIETH